MLRLPLGVATGRAGVPRESTGGGTPGERGAVGRDTSAAGGGADGSGLWPRATGTLGAGPCAAAIDAGGAGQPCRTQSSHVVWSWATPGTP